MRAFAQEHGSRPFDAVISAYSPSASASRERLHRLLERQFFRLSWWRTAADEVNWRRFFDIGTLAAVRTERIEVFDAVHALVLRLFAQGLIDGVRIDHVDGLVDPREYCQRLREKLAERNPNALRNAIARALISSSKRFSREANLYRAIGASTARPDTIS